MKHKFTIEHEVSKGANISELLTVTPLVRKTEVLYSCFDKLLMFKLAVS